jgi:hypothetical protein
MAEHLYKQDGSAPAPTDAPAPSGEKKKKDDDDVIDAEVVN